MKKLILLLCFFVLVSSKIFSQIYTENFDYTAGSLLTTNDAWGATSGGGTIPITVTAPGLDFPNYAGSGIGNAVTLTTPTTASGEDDTARFTTFKDTGYVYVSFMVNVDTAKTGDYFLALLNQSGSPTIFVGRVFVKEDSLGVAFGLSKNSGTANLYTSSIYFPDTTYLLVLKYCLNPGVGDDSVSLFVFGPSDVLPAIEPLIPTLGPFGGATDLGNVGKVLLRQGAVASSPTLQVDGIYATNTWNNSVLPVELTSLTASVNNRDITLNWTTASELNNSGFDIERLASRSGSIVNGSPREAGQWSMIGFVQGNGTSSTSHNYSFTDRGLATGRYNYRLKQIDYNGNFEYFNLNSEIGIGVPIRYDLSQNYPNPFNPSTKINFDIPFDGKVSVKLFDVSGREILSLVNEVKAAGYYTINFNATNLSSGVYFYTINADNNGQSANGGFVSTKKMMLVK